MRCYRLKACASSFRVPARHGARSSARGLTPLTALLGACLLSACGTSGAVASDAESGSDATTSNEGGNEGNDEGNDDSTSESGDEGPIACEPSELECAGACVDPATDEVHCGACDQSCEAGEQCLAGACYGEQVEGLELLSPAPGYQRTFVKPEIRWEPVGGTTDYTVDIARDDAFADIVASTTTTSDRWRPDVDFMGDLFWVRVSANPSGAWAARPFVVRGFEAEPDATSPTVICDTSEGIGSMNSYALAVVGDKVFASFNVDGSGVCVHDTETLEYEIVFAGLGGNMRSYGVAADHEGDRIFASFFPLAGMCGDTLDRLLIIDDASTDSPSMRWVNAGTEAAHSLAYVPGSAAGEGELLMSGLNQVSCWDENGFCLDLNEPCSNGNAAFVGWRIDAGELRFQNTDGWAAPGMTADDARVYRASVVAGLDVYDRDGSLLFNVATPETARSASRFDAEGERFLVLSQWDETLRIYRLGQDPVVSADDFERVNEVVVGDRYWQGDFDAQGRFWFVRQLDRAIARHEIKP